MTRYQASAPDCDPILASDVHATGQVDGVSASQLEDADFDRRAALRVGLVLGAGALLAGCTSSGSSRSRRPMSPVGQRTNATKPPAAKTGEPEFVSHKPAWLDDWRAGSATMPAGVEPRSAWARYGPNMSLSNPMGKISRITIHHDGMNAFTSPTREDAIRRIEAIRSAHVNQGWADIGYHYVIDPGGRVWQARPISLQGAHVRDQNASNLGIMVMGNYSRQTVTSASLASLQYVIASNMRTYRIPVSRVHTHNELASTECPGTDLHRQMDRLRGGVLA